MKTKKHPAPATPDQPQPATLSAEKLCSLSGLTDRRHRQLAKEGFFPPPIRSQYQAGATVQGLLRYYRELDQRKRHMKDAIDEQKHLKLKLANDEKSGLLTDTSKLADQVAASLIAFRDSIYQKLENEAPTAMSTLDVPSARIIGRRLAENLILKIQEIFSAWKL